MPVKQLKLNLKPMLKKFEVFVKRNMTSDLTGGYMTAIKGRGLEFEGFRPYSINDDASQIDWKATLKSQQTLVKRYVEERSLNVLFVFDVSNSMLFASTEKLKAEYAAELISSISFAALRTGDYVGLIMFNERIVCVVPGMMGTKQYYTIISKLSDPQLYGGGIDFASALRFMTGYIAKRAMVIVVSDFLGLKGDWEREMILASEKFDLLAIMIRDPHDLTIPAGIGQIVIQDPFSEDQMVISSSAAKGAFEKTAAEQKHKLLEIFKRHRVPVLELATDQPFVNPVTNFFKRHRF